MKATTLSQQSEPSINMTKPTNTRKPPWQPIERRRDDQKPLTTVRRPPQDQRDALSAAEVGGASSQHGEPHRPFRTWR